MRRSESGEQEGGRTRKGEEKKKEGALPLRAMMTIPPCDPGSQREMKIGQQSSTWPSRWGGEER
jgi:hypothetical protein